MLESSGMSDTKELSTATYWDNRYRDERDGWDLGQAPDWLDQHAKHLPASKVLVVGCGRGHDALSFAKAGHEVQAIDFSPRAIEDAKAASTAFGPTQLRFRLADVFDMGQGELADMAGAFDLVWEQTCLCAIEPARRKDYFQAVSRVLRPGGQWHAILWAHGKEGGPPFHLDAKLVQAMVPEGFTQESQQDILDPEGSRKRQHLVEYST